MIFLLKNLENILQLFDKAKGVFGVENNKPDAIAKLKELVKNEPRMEVCELMTKYPQGGERQLIYAVTGRAINSKMLPADAGCIVDNVETMIAVYNAVKNGIPVMKRVATITGDAIANPSNFLYSMGTPYEQLVEAAGGFKVQPEKIISGGPMMGFAMCSVIDLERISDHAENLGQLAEKMRDNGLKFSQVGVKDFFNS